MASITHLINLFIFLSALLLTGCFKKTTEIEHSEKKDLKAPVQITIIDSFFCSEKLNLTKNIRIIEKRNLFQDVSKCPKNIIDQSKFHGHFVLKTFLKNFNSKKEIHLRLISAYSLRGKTSSSKIAKFLQKQKESDYILMAMGVPSKNIERPIDHSFILSHPRIGIGINKDMKIYPQSFVSQKNSLIIGTFHDIPDSEIKQKDNSLFPNIKSDYQFPYLGKNGFNGTSHAAPYFLGKALSLCYLKTIDSLKSCLKNHQKTVNIDNKEQVFTF